jgi:addiction module HigA family antidote
MVREDFMADYSLTVSSLAEKLAVSGQTINELINERRSLSPTMALSLARLFGNTPEFWMSAQRAVDLWAAEKENKKALGRIKPLQAA